MHTRLSLCQGASHTLCCPFFTLETLPLSATPAEWPTKQYNNTIIIFFFFFFTKEVVETFQSLSLLHLKGAAPPWRRKWWYWIPQGNSLKIKILPEFHVNFNAVINNFKIVGLWISNLGETVQILSETLGKGLSDHLGSLCQRQRASFLSTTAASHKTWKVELEKD